VVGTGRSTPIRLPKDSPHHVKFTSVGDRLGQAGSIQGRRGARLRRGPRFSVSLLTARKRRDVPVRNLRSFRNCVNQTVLVLVTMHSLLGGCRQPAAVSIASPVLGIILDIFADGLPNQPERPKSEPPASGTNHRATDIACAVLAAHNAGTRIPRACRPWLRLLLWVSAPKGLPVRHTFAGGPIYPTVGVRSPNCYAFVNPLPMDGPTNGKLPPVPRGTCNRSPVCHRGKILE
jgi:hypothetical protein